VTIFPKTVYKTITNTTETTKTVEAFALYAGAGLWHYNNSVIPHASIAAKIPKNWIILADVGYYDNSVILGGTALYKFTQK
jgi:predicted oxidoreductase (fatty acid repression mutant protein)